MTHSGQGSKCVSRTSRRRLLLLNQRPAEKTANCAGTREKNTGCRTHLFSFLQYSFDGRLQMWLLRVNRGVRVNGRVRVPTEFVAHRQKRQSAASATRCLSLETKTRFKNGYKINHGHELSIRDLLVLCLVE